MIGYEELAGDHADLFVEPDPEEAPFIVMGRNELTCRTDRGTSLEDVEIDNGGFLRESRQKNNHPEQ